MLKLLLAPFRILFKILGVNYNQLYAILKAKLTMDNRRSISFSNQNNTPKNQIAMQVVMYGFMGLMFLVVIISMPSALLGYTIFFSMVMLMIALAMIIEFTTLLFDTRDNYVLASRPVNNETLATAKIFHIAIYMLIISLSISLPVVIYTLVKFGVGAMLLFLALLVFTSFFILFLTNIFYFVLSNLVSSRRMKDIVVYIQVAMAILFMAGYQLMPRIFDYYDVENIGDMVLEWWHLAIPPVWMSAGLEIAIQGIYDTKHIVFLIFAIAIPILSLILVVKVLSPRFNKAVQQEERVQKTKKTTKIIQRKQGWVARLSQIFTSNMQEAACFEMVWKMSSRERIFKQSVYPTFGYLLIFILMYFFKGKEFSLDSLRAGKRYLMYLYLPIILSFSLIVSLSFSDNKKSSWFFRAMPIDGVGIILRGALKAVLIKYFVPAFIITALGIFYIWGIAVIDDVLLAFVVNIVVAIFLQRSLVHDLPFTTQKNANDTNNNFVKGILVMISIGLTIGVHFGLTLINYAVAIATVPFLISMFILLKTYNKMSWDRIYS